jgi:hypothetical protein
MDLQALPLKTPATPARSRWLTLRAACIGTVLVVLTCAIAPYNDYVVLNTFMIGSYLPLVLVLALFFLVVVVNGTLLRFAPRAALTPGEMSVIIAMLLAACAIPTQGLMRFWLPSLVAPFWFGQTDVVFWKAFVGMELPGWLFPVESIEAGRNDPIVRDVYRRMVEGQPIPYGAWITPILGWSVFIAAWMASLVSLALMVVPQWAYNERLPFPLAQIQAAVIEPPQRGRSFNALFASRAFWIGLGVVFLIHSINALRPHFPDHIPEIPLRYNFSAILSEPPLSYLHGSVKAATIYFTFIGVAYFIQSRVAFSLWVIFLLTEVVQVQVRVLGHEVPAGAKQYQHFGAAVAYATGVLWIGRHHWAKIARHVVFGRQAGESSSYRIPGLVFLLAISVMFVWLLVTRVQPWAAGVIVGLILLVHFVVTRFVAETGMPFWRCQVEAKQIWSNVPSSMITTRDVFMGGLATSGMGGLATRESLMPMVTHAYRVEQEVEEQAPRYRLLTGLMIWSLALGFVVAAWSSLRMYYTYDMPITQETTIRSINPHGLEHKPINEVIDPVRHVASGRFPDTNYSAVGHFTFGAVLTGVLQVLALRSSAWPFMPVGYVACFTWYLEMAWYSIMLGWLCKVLILRFGGATMFMQLRPLFVGIIFGEALAAATWLVVNIVLAAQGLTYYPIYLLPS